MAGTPLERLDDLEARVTKLENATPNQGVDPFVRAGGGSTTGQAPPSQTAPPVDSRLRLVWNPILKTWILPGTGAFAGAKISGGRTVMLVNGTFFDLVNDVDYQGYVTTHPMSELFG